MDKEYYKKLLEKQHYSFVGEHSAVKTCTWTKKSLKDEGVCYKQQFYGINSHRCVQISVTVNFCDLSCVYCWRDRFNFPFEKIDEPKEVIEKSILAQRKLLSGLGGFEKLNKGKFKQAQNPIHFAISLTGETLYYPKLSELIKELKKRNMSSFVVTNGQLPKVLEKLEPPTQLYISIDSPNEQLHNKICMPEKKDSWQRLMKSLEIMKKLKKKTRTTLRLTMVKDYNMVHPEQYAKLIEKADPLFVEVKAYMFVGASRERLSIENMPRHHEIKTFAEEICRHCDYKIIDEHSPSRVALLMKEDFPERIMKF
jgi:tRNA wybutosine-synthesizing protein 1